MLQTTGQNASGVLLTQKGLMLCSYVCKALRLCNVVKQPAGKEQTARRAMSVRQDETGLEAHLPESACSTSD